MRRKEIAGITTFVGFLRVCQRLHPHLNPLPQGEEDAKRPVRAILSRLSPQAVAGFVLLAAVATACADDKAELSPQIFAAGIISTDLDESCGSFSPDGQSFYFVRRGAYTTSPPISIICFSEFRDGKWSHPEVASFSGMYLDGSHYFSSDGKRLYFGSKRPIESNPKGRDWNIWFVERVENGWSEPKEIGNPINGPQNDTNPAPAADWDALFYVRSR
jgi:hypothetical protein